ncbi:MAG: hybrid sensor histidine kinase/response regulator, partial [Deltaproteobacteria bacterium]|nr:hybrid sensor histidine kinase/response regulator [Deltaproteobacteria bacterium]
MIRVLLVEDNPGDARLIQELLRELPAQPYEITHVATLGEALALVADRDVALLDLTLPDAAGLASVERTCAAARALPIVVLTGNADERVAIEALNAGAQDYLRKGEITATLLDKAMRYAIERKRMIALEVAQQHLEQTIAHARFIAAVTSAATSSLEAEPCIRAVAPLLVPTLADGCAIDLFRDGKAERIASAGEFGDGAARLDTRLIARGRTVGGIALTMGSSGRRFGDEERLIAEEITVRLALSIDNAMHYAEAQRALRGRDEMMAIVSHDLRNPLAVVQLSLSALATDPASLAVVLPRATRAVERMGVLIEDLLQIGQIDAGTLVIEPRPVELDSLLDDVLEQHRVLGAGKGVRVQREPSLPLGSVMLDPNRLTQALGNLLGNAIKFTPADGTITLAATSTSSGVEISVSDTGPGISTDQVARIFDRFWQADRRRRDGVGLGLPIAKGIVDAHGGRLDVRSEL